MLDRFITWLVFDSSSDAANFGWKIKTIAIELKLYKPDKYELECIEHNKKIKRK